MPKPNKLAAGVMFDPDVLAILAALAGSEGRSRSWIVNYIIRLYAQQLAARERDAAQRLTTTIPRGGSRNSGQRLNYDCDFWGWSRCSFRTPPLIASWRRRWNRALPALPCACALSALWLTLAFRWAFRLRGGAPQCGYDPLPPPGTWSVGAGDLNRWSVGFCFLSIFKCRHM
jgi:hypothetical protein